MKIDKAGRKLSDCSLASMGGKGRFKRKHGMKGTAEYRASDSVRSKIRHGRPLEGATPC